MTYFSDQYSYDITVKPTSQFLIPTKQRRLLREMLAPLFAKWDGTFYRGITLIRTLMADEV
jgi:hypothetical protein